MTAWRLREGRPQDAGTISALAVQVFLDTYATEGVRPDLAREAFEVYSERAFAARLGEPERRFIVAESEGLVGFVEVKCLPLDAPAGGVRGAELVRLYVQPRVQGAGLGRTLLLDAERMATAFGLAGMWLTAWAGNARALAFYSRMGYADVGCTEFRIEDRAYDDRVFFKRLP